MRVDDYMGNVFMNDFMAFLAVCVLVCVFVTGLVVSVPINSSSYIPFTLTKSVSDEPAMLDKRRKNMCKHT